MSMFFQCVNTDPKNNCIQEVLRICVNVILEPVKIQEFM
jgi:hypothetical protein